MTANNTEAGRVSAGGHPNVLVEAKQAAPERQTRIWTRLVNVLKALDGCNWFDEDWADIEDLAKAKAEARQLLIDLSVGAQGRAAPKRGLVARFKEACIGARLLG